METLNRLSHAEWCRVYVLKRIKSYGRNGYRLTGEESEWWGETLIDLHRDMMVLQKEIPGGSGFAWHLTELGEKKLKAVKK
jgi:hypothetical protein